MHGRPRSEAGVGVDAAGNVEREDFTAAGVDTLDSVGENTLERARETRSE